MSGTQGEIAIVGGGIGGLTLALGLARAGEKPVVYEQAIEHSEVGAGISLAPNAVKGLRFLGVEPAIVELADEPMEQYTRHYQTGQPLVTIDRHNTASQFGASYLQMHRADLQAILLDALKAHAPDCLRLGHRLADISQSSDGVTLSFEERAPVDAALVVASDGLRSVTRGQVFGELGANYSGIVAWRGLIPTERLAGCDLLPESNVFVGPDRIFVRYPVRKGQIQNCVAFTREPEWQAEGWMEKGDLGELKAAFADFHPDVTQVLDAFLPKECFRWGLFERQPLPRWVDGRVAVLGDAAHPMLPWFGLGAATAIEDAVILARALTEFASVDEALQRYQAARYERVTEIHRESLAGGERLMTAHKTLYKSEPVVTEDTLGMTLYDPGTVAL
ncbi:MAG: FAD-dependent monooxygenase [Pseudomonadota bacterium]